MPGGRHPIEVSDIEGHQSAGSVEHIDGGRFGGVGMAHSGGEDDGYAVLPTQRQEPASLAQAARSALGTTMADRLQDEGIRRQRRPPPSERGIRIAFAPGEHCAPDVGVGSEQHADRRGLSGDRWGGRGAQQIEGGHGCAACPRKVSGGDQPAQPGPPHPGGDSRAGSAGQDRHSRQPRVDDGASSHGGARATTHRSVRRTWPGPPGCPGQRLGLHRQIDPEDRIDASRSARLDEPDRTVEPVAVGEREGRVPEGRRPGHKSSRGGGAVLHGIARGHMQVDEMIHV